MDTTTQQEILDLIKEHGGWLERDNGHRVFKFPDGRSFTQASSPSDQCSYKNNLSDLRHFLGIVPQFQAGERREHKRQAVPNGFEMPLNAAAETDAIVVPMGECFACGKPWEMSV